MRVTKPHSVTDQRGIAKQLKRVLPGPWFRACTVAFNRAVGRVPYRVKYGIGGWLRGRKVPYALVRPGDVVVQVGAPRDLLAAGRSRAMHFARLVHTGRVIIVEPDPANVAALRAYAERHGLASRLAIFSCGAWSESTELAFLANPAHPAANVLADVVSLSETEQLRKGFRIERVPVRDLDGILAEAGTPRPRLVSITTNGAELQILAGMGRTLAAGVPYISLASTGPGLHEAMDSRGYDYFVRDDRGYCFRRRETSA